MSKITNKQAIEDWSWVSMDEIEKYAEEGDFWKKNLLNSVLFGLLGNIEGKEILEVRCGSGYLCRLMAKQGAKVVGLEPAESFYNYAVEEEKRLAQGVEYVQKDLSEMTEFESNFDAVVANMVFLDIPDYRPAMRNSIKALKPGGDFIFSLAHPCFFSSMDWSKQPFVKIDRYFDEYSEMGGTGRYFHRSLSDYINLVIEEGCVIKKFVEPRLSKELAEAHPDKARDYHVPGFLVVKGVKS